jgi:hypothetical protein
MTILNVHIISQKKLFFFPPDIAEAEDILRLILSGTLVPIAYSDIPLDRLRDIV